MVIDCVKSSRRLAALQEAAEFWLPKPEFPQPGCYRCHNSYAFASLSSFSSFLACRSPQSQNNKRWWGPLLHAFWTSNKNNYRLSLEDQGIFKERKKSDTWRFAMTTKDFLSSAIIKFNIYSKIFNYGLPILISSKSYRIGRLWRRMGSIYESVLVLLTFMDVLFFFTGWHTNFIGRIYGASRWLFSCINWRKFYEIDLNWQYF